MIKFYKYQGAGNDFVMIDNRMNTYSDDKVSIVKKLCERRFGIGSDGLIFIENHDELDFVMDFYNPDGSQSFCGNGSRCAVAFACFIGAVQTNRTRFMAIDGVHEAEINSGRYKVSMHDVDQIEKNANDFFIDTGSPHYISYCDANDERDIVEYGRTIRYSEKYAPNGTNVNLVEVIDEHKINIRTYERGVEAETFACGTGATACALSYAHLTNRVKGEIEVGVKGGSLKVYFSKSANGFNDIWLEGPAKEVFEGVFDYKNERENIK